MDNSFVRKLSAMPPSSNSHTPDQDQTEAKKRQALVKEVFSLIASSDRQAEGSPHSYLHDYQGSQV